MITEDYCSYEVAKLLKEKGFDEPCRTFYEEKELVNDVCTQYYQWNTKSPFGHISAPTIQMTMKWLREVHKLVICAEIGNENDKGNTDYSNPDRWYWFFDITNEKGVVIDTESDYVLNEYSSYEQACEAAIKYCLEDLI